MSDVAVGRFCSCCAAAGRRSLTFIVRQVAVYSPGGLAGAVAVGKCQHCDCRRCQCGGVVTDVYAARCPYCRKKL